MGTEGYIAVVNNIKSNKYTDIGDGSPVFQLKNDQLIPIQYFTTPHQNRVQLLRVHNMLFMFQTYDNVGMKEMVKCPILKWSDSTFDVFDSLPCMNAQRIEPFIIEHQIFVAIANNMDERGNNSDMVSFFEIFVSRSLRFSKFSFLEVFESKIVFCEIYGIFVLPFRQP